MSTSLSTLDAQTALHYFRPNIRAQLISLGNRGGFSGASIWRVEGEFAPLCLKAWPEQTMDAAGLEWMHALLMRAWQARLLFVPEVQACPHGKNWVHSSGRYWDLTTWMPGQADFHEHPSPARLSGAAFALAQIHAAWQVTVRPLQPCPSVDRRLVALADWTELLASGWRLVVDQVPVTEWRPLLSKAWALALTHEPRVRVMLEAWREKPVMLQPCIGDVWHDHVLYQGDRISGIIDFGAVRQDHPAADLGRLIGSLIADDDAGWATALAAYRALRPFSWEQEALARLLDRSGVVVSLLNWLRWCGRGERTFSDPRAVTKHLAALVERVETWRDSNLIAQDG